jgi:2'-5' RNA ligase
MAAQGLVIMIRTFVAVELEPELRLAIGRMQDQLKERLKADLREKASTVRLQWVRPESIHLTVKFLGDIDEQQVESICRGLAQAVSGLPPFSLVVQEIGVFPNIRAPRVLWVGLASQPDQFAQLESLKRLAGEVDRALHGLGFPLETRPFSPHLTLARIKERPHEVGKTLSEKLMPLANPLGTLHVGSVALMKSDLRPSGSVYTRLCESPLTPA